jgi:outer membrane protein assembly factor BamB
MVAGMYPCWRTTQFASIVAIIPAMLCAEFAAWGQALSSIPGSRFELAERVELDRADSTVARSLERVKEYLAAEQWDEAVETLRQVQENSGGKLWGVSDRRFVSVRDYCHLQLASLPPPALALYRRRADPVAKKWYDDGVARKEPRLLHKVVDEAFASSWGDDALFMLGEIALERGEYAAARADWEKIIPVPPPADGPRTWLCVPGTDLDLAAVRARLVLVSILEGSLDRARDELSQFTRLHPNARGRLGGEERNYAEALGALLSEAAGWPAAPTTADWPTFAGSPQRNKQVAQRAEAGTPAWRVALRPAPSAHNSLWGSGVPIARVAEDPRAPLSYHPVVVDNLVLLDNQVEILALDAKTGSPAWGHEELPIYRDQFDESIHANYNPPNNLGVPRFTMTVKDHKLYARMGPSVTTRLQEAGSSMAGGYLVCLDLEAEGRLAWRITPDDKDWAFEGSPLCEGGNVYVVMRRSDIQPQVHVACFDARNGDLRWRRFLCAAETPARGMMYETTHTLLTLNRGTLYCNTNLGAVAAISAHDGQVQWVSLYPRDRQGDLLQPEPHWSRDLNPCLYDRGTLLAAPTDSRRIFAFDATTGQILWQTGPEVENIVHLLGVVGNQLIASGDRLYWISLQGNPGRITQIWPDGQERLGYGRGLLAGGTVYFPTREAIYLFDSATARQKGMISLRPQGLTGGNLLVADGRLLIAGNKELIALGGPRPPKKEEKPLAIHSLPDGEPRRLAEPVAVIPIPLHTPFSQR